MNLDTYMNTVAELLHALGTLQLGQGLIARRNARKRVNAALRKLLKWMDAEFPLQRRSGTRKRLTPQQRTARFQRAGWARVSRSSATYFLGTKVPTKTARTAGNGLHEQWAPKWAIDLLRGNHVNPSNAWNMLRRAALDKRFREAQLAIIQLKQMGTP